MPADDTLSSIELLALSRLFDPRTARGKGIRQEVDPGEYAFDFTINVQGRMVVREDYTSHIVGKAQPWTLLMLLADKVNATTLAKLVREAEAIEASDPRVTQFKERVHEAMQQIKKPTETECKGSVKTEAVVQPVGKPTIAA